MMDIKKLKWFQIMKIYSFQQNKKIKLEYLPILVSQIYLIHYII